MAVGESVRYPSVCETCGAVAECDGGEGLGDGEVRWDIARSCAACGMYVIAFTGEEWGRWTRYSYESYSNTAGWAGS